jgi:hypothetical protein
MRSEADIRHQEIDHALEEGGVCRRSPDSAR